MSTTQSPSGLGRPLRLVEVIAPVSSVHESNIAKSGHSKVPSAHPALKERPHIFIPADDALTSVATVEQLHNKVASCSPTMVFADTTGYFIIFGRQSHDIEAFQRCYDMHNNTPFLSHPPLNMQLYPHGITAQARPSATTSAKIGISSATSGTKETAGQLTRPSVSPLDVARRVVERHENATLDSGRQVPATQKALVDLTSAPMSSSTRSSPNDPPHLDSDRIHEKRRSIDSMSLASGQGSSIPSTRMSNYDPRLCFICRRGSPNDMMLVKCPKCKRRYHRRCPRPVIPSEVGPGWQCYKCDKKSRESAKTPSMKALGMTSSPAYTKESAGEPPSKRQKVDGGQSDAHNVAQPQTSEHERRVVVPETPESPLVTTLLSSQAAQSVGTSKDEHAVGPLQLHSSQPPESHATDQMNPTATEKTSDMSETSVTQRAPQVVNMIAPNDGIGIEVRNTDVQRMVTSISKNIGFSGSIQEAASERHDIAHKVSDPLEDSEIPIEATALGNGTVCGTVTLRNPICPQSELNANSESISNMKAGVASGVSAEPGHGSSEPSWPSFSGNKTQMLDQVDNPFNGPSATDAEESMKQAQQLDIDELLADCRAAAEPKYSCKDLYEQWPQYRPADESVSIEEIKKRPTRKQMFGKSGSRVRPAHVRAKLNAIREGLRRKPRPIANGTTSAMNEDESEHGVRSRQSRSNSNHRGTGGADEREGTELIDSAFDRDEPKEFSDLDDLLGMPDNMIPMIEDSKQLAFRDATMTSKGRLGRAKNIYRIGQAAKEI